MKKTIPYLIPAAFLVISVLQACKKEPSCEGCNQNNKSPISNAGPDQVITLPTGSVLLDGSASSDPDGKISAWLWTKVAGPASFTISNNAAVKAIVKDLKAGIYQFELKVTDDKGASAKDTVQVSVNAACDISNRPQINAQLIPVGSLSQAGTGMAAASAGNKILFAGPDSRVDIFNIAANTWSIAQLSSVRGGITAVGAANKVFFAGGQDDDGYSVPTVDIYDVSTNTWSVSQLSRGADGLAAATVGDKVFFAGGNCGIYAVSTVDIYNLTTNTWSVASLSAKRNYITPVSGNNKVYFTGGDPWTGQASNVIDIYDNNTGTWSTSTLQVPRAYHAAIAVNDVLYFAGGKSSQSSPSFCSVETWNVNTGARSLMNLSGPASGQKAVVKDNRIIFQGHDDTADTIKFDIYDIQTKTWSVGKVPMSISRASVISVNNTIYLAGGYVNGTLSNKVWRLEF